MLKKNLKKAAAVVGRVAHSVRNQAIAVVGGVAALGTTMAHATLDPTVTAAFTSISTDASDMFAAAIPVIGAVVGFTVLIKLFKRFTNKV